MNAPATTPRKTRFRLAWRLAMLAVVAQFVLGFVSTGHHARLLGAGAGVVEVCTADGFIRVAADGSSVPNDEDPARLDGGAHCAICAVAAESPLPLGLAEAPRYPQPPPALVPASATVAPLATVLALRPPPRAPPLSS